MKESDKERDRTTALARWQLVEQGMIEEAGVDWLREIARKVLEVANEPASYRRQMITEAVGLDGTPTPIFNRASVVEAIAFVETLPSDSSLRQKSAVRLIAEWMQWTRAEDDPDPKVSDRALRSDAAYTDQIKTLLKHDPPLLEWFASVRRNHG